jgi:hypothetical protein
MRSYAPGTVPARANDHACECGYQIAVEPPHPVCPMCGEWAWVALAGSRQAILPSVRTVLGL